MSTVTKKTEEDVIADTPVKSKKKLIIIIIAVLLLASGSAAAYFLLKPSHDKPGKEKEAHAEVKVTYLSLGTFTANLIHEEGDRYLQVAMEVKLTNPALAERIKTANPEVQHHINMVLQGKRPSELTGLSGKQKLARELKEQIEVVLGLRKEINVEPISAHSSVAAVNLASSSVVATSAVSAPGESAVAEAPTEESLVVPNEPNSGDSGIAEVLFTSFIIQ